MDLAVLHVDDDGFVRAPAADCYRLLTDVAGWPRWWDGTRVRPRGGDDRHRVTLGPRLRRTRLDVRAHGWRHERGFRLAVSGDLTGEVEFWLEPGWGGTVVHHLATLRGGRAPAHRRYRQWVRRGLWGAKDRIHRVALAAEAT